MTWHAPVAAVGECSTRDPDRAGNLLEVVVIERDDGTELAIHAMHMRSKYQPLLPRPERQHDE